MLSPCQSATARSSSVMLSTFVALSVNSAKHLGPSNQILRFAQDDTSRQLRMTQGYDTINTFKAKLPPFGFNMLETIVTTYIDKHQLLPPGGEVIVAVSGGGH